MTTDQHLDTGAMALDALPDDEAAQYRDHLTGCPSCSAELAGFLETAALLGSSVAQTPPASLRKSVMEAIAQTKQLAPLRAVPALDTHILAELGRHRHPAAQPAEQLSAENLAHIIPIKRAWYRRPQALIAAAVALLVVGGGVTFAVSHPFAVTPSASECVAATANKAVIALTVGTGGHVTLAPDCDTALVTFPALADPPAGKVYQLWVMKGAASTSAGTITKSPTGGFVAAYAAVHAGDTAVAVSLEPAPGSAQPTPDPIWVARLTS